MKCCIHVIPALRRLKPENCWEFKASLSYAAKPFLKKLINLLIKTEVEEALLMKFLKVIL